LYVTVQGIGHEELVARVHRDTVGLAVFAERLAPTRSGHHFDDPAVETIC
jgi:hypothetical protein